MNAYHIGNLAAPVFPAGTRLATLAGLAQASDELFTQLATGHGINGGVDRLMADVEAAVVRIHAPEYASNLFRGVKLAQQ